MAARLIKIGTNKLEIIEFPNVLIFFRPTQAPTGGTKGTTVNHIGFSVPNLRQTVDKVKATGFQMITGAEVAANAEGEGRHRGHAARTTSIAFVMGPDDVKVELVENKAQTMPITLHHVHFFGQQNTDMQAWYVEDVRREGRAPRGELPGRGPPGRRLELLAVAGSGRRHAGRALDHIGFEVKNLEAFCKKLEADGIKLDVPYRKVPALNIAIAFITDPWGTYIELNEDLDKVS